MPTRLGLRVSKVPQGYRAHVNRCVRSTVQPRQRRRRAIFKIEGTLTLVFKIDHTFNTLMFNIDHTLCTKFYLELCDK